MSVNHQENIIEIENVSFAYDKENVLQNINLCIHKGDYLGLVGSNGAGKTTLVKLILGILPLKSGAIKIFKKNIKNFKDWSKISYVSQRAVNFDINFPATVFEVVLMARYAKKGLFKFITKDDKLIAQEMIKKVGLIDYKDTLIGNLSGGEQQRVFVARALAQGSEIIFFDEPFTGVDQKTQDDFYMLLKELNSNLGITIILVSHDIERILKEAMHIACINKSLTCHSSPEDFIKESLVENISGENIKIIKHQHN